MKALDPIVEVTANYLRARAKADGGELGVSPDSLMFARAADLIIEQAGRIDAVKESLLTIQKKLLEMESRGGHW
jgi:hypothetical protein